MLGEIDIFEWMAALFTWVKSDKGCSSKLSGGRGNPEFVTVRLLVYIQLSSFKGQTLQLNKTHSCWEHYSLLTLKLSSSWHLTPFMVGSLPQGPCFSSHLSPLITALTIMTHSRVSSPHVDICVYNSARTHFSPGVSWLPYKSVMHVEVRRDRKYH